MLLYIWNICTILAHSCRFGPISNVVLTMLQLKVPLSEHGRQKARDSGCTISDVVSTMTKGCCSAYLALYCRKSGAGSIAAL